MIRRFITSFTLCILVFVISGCTVNPVTGKTELAMTSTEQELSIGRAQYQSAQQSQGGRYIVDPALNQYIQKVGSQLAAVSDRPQLPFEFVVVNNSSANAWALPGGKIAINRGLLLELDDESQLAAVLSHEIVHTAARHGAQQMDRKILTGIGVAAIAATAKDHQYGATIIGGAALGATLINSRYSRQAELESDHYGMQYMAKLGYELDGAVELQETFVELSEGGNNSISYALFASHPPSHERVQANIKTASTLNSGKIRNRAIYQRHIAQLKKDVQAYNDCDEGFKLLAKNPQQSLLLANKAIRSQPKEALFYQLKSQALSALNNNTAALDAINQAIQRNPGYYSFYITRGQLYQAMGNTQAARQDFDNSNRLLPNAIAINKQ